MEFFPLLTIENQLFSNLTITLKNNVIDIPYLFLAS